MSFNSGGGDLGLLSALSGNFKTVYHKEMLDLVPDECKLVKEVPFESKERVGDHWEVPVILQDEQGFVYAGSTDDGFDTPLPISMKTQPAKVDGYQTLLASEIGYAAAAKSAAGGTAAFKEVTQLKVQNMVRSHRKRLEISCWYGRSPLAVISAKTNVDATHETLTFSAASWAPGMWVGRDNGTEVSFYDPASNHMTVVANSEITNILVKGNYQITAVDPDARTITVTGVALDITALDSITLSHNVGIYFRGSFIGSFGGSPAVQDMLGVAGQVSGFDISSAGVITQDASRFNIDPTAFNLWKGTRFDCGSQALTFQKVQQAISKAVGRGLDEDVTLWVSPATWSDLMNDMMALRKLDNSYSKRVVETGSHELEFYTQNDITVTVRSHAVIKAGEAYILPHSHLMRVGAWDISFSRPGGGPNGSGGDIFFDIPTRTSYGFRSYGHQAIVLTAPAKAIILQNIVNG